MGVIEKESEDSEVVNGVHVLDAKSTQLLNTLTYNYGEIFNAVSSSHLSDLNRLAVCTEKCLCLLSFRSDWPPPIKPVKFMSKLRNLDVKDNSQLNIAAPHIDNWIQDLVETRNEAFFVNVIDCVPKSKLVESMFLKYYVLEREARAHRKSFYRSLRDSAKAINDDDDDDDELETRPRFKRSKAAATSSKKKSPSKDADEAPRSQLNKIIVENHEEEYQKHLTLFELSQLFDPTVFEYLSLINPQNTSTPSQSNNSQASSSSINQLDGFVSCQWNHHAYSSLLFAVTRTNQMLIFDCTRLRENDMIANRAVIANKAKKSGNVQEDCTNVFDLKTESVYFNLTEFWLLKQRSHLISRPTSSIFDFVHDLNEFLPACFEWSRPIKLITGPNAATVDLLFVVFRSNLLAIFQVSRDQAGKLQVDLLDSVSLLEIIDSAHPCEDMNDDESQVPNLFSDKEKRSVASLSFSQQAWELALDSKQSTTIGVLAVGLSDGRLLLATLKSSLFRNQQIDKPALKFCQLENSWDNLTAEKLTLFQLVGQKAKPQDHYLVVVQKETRLLFVTVEHDKAKDSFRTTGQRRLYHKLASEVIDKKENFIVNNCVKLLDFKLIGLSQDEPWVLKPDQITNIELLLCYSDSSMEQLKLSLSVKATAGPCLDGIKTTLVNDAQLVSFDLLDSSQSGDQRASKKSKNSSSAFKSTSNIFLSRNQFLLFQVNDFTKAPLILKKPPHFQINVYAIQSVREGITRFLDPSVRNQDLSSTRQRELANMNDLIWAFKYQLYTNTSFFDRNLFQLIYSRIKNGSSVISNIKGAAAATAKDMLTHLKRLRCVCLILAEYFESASTFDQLNDANKSGGNQELIEEEYDDDDDDDDDDDEDDDDDSVETSSDEENGPEAAEKPANLVTQTSTTPTTSTGGSEKPRTTQDDIIRSHQYYRSMCREFSLIIFMFHAYSIFLLAFESGLDKLNLKEKTVLAQIAEFGTKKNLFKDELLASLTTKKAAVSKWINSNFLESGVSFKNNDLLNDLKCEICTKSIDIQESNDLSTLKCQAGHRVSRCEKTLLPLDSLKFTKCTRCGSSWNNRLAEQCPNLQESFVNQLACVFCD